MKRALKILGWTLLSIVLAVVLVASIAIYVVFTPERLTPIARQAADKFITCEHEIGEVDLTFFSTFPRFGLRADGLLLINPKAGAQNDTIVEAKHLVATVDVMEFFNNKNLHVHEAILDDATVNFYIAAYFVEVCSSFLKVSGINIVAFGLAALCSVERLQTVSLISLGGAVNLYAVKIKFVSVFIVPCDAHSLLAIL